MSVIKSSFSMDTRVYDKLGQIADKKGLSKSVILTLAINDLYDKEFKDVSQNIA